MTWGGVGLAATLFGGVAALSWLILAPSIAAQETGDVARRIAAAPDGSIRFSYAAREGVCGDGHHISIHHDTEGPRDWTCHDGPVWVEVEKSGRQVVDLDMWVGGAPEARGSARTELGDVGTREAADYLLDLARRADSDFGDEAIGAASLAADVVIWPQLMDMARDESLDADTREGAIFWLAQLAGDKATEGLEEIVRSDSDTEVKEAALFGLSQLPDGAGFDALMKVAREGQDADLVQASLFWLGQTGDPRAISLFEEILARD
jgi:HEAT repeat protein